MPANYRLASCVCGACVKYVSVSSELLLTAIYHTRAHRPITHTTRTVSTARLELGCPFVAAIGVTVLVRAVVALVARGKRPPRVRLPNRLPLT
jgi:hypothetical protein